MGCTIEDSSARVEHETPQGLLINHAYSILGAEEYKGTKLVRVRNPWGRCEWKGAWADESKEWTPVALKHFNYSFANDGTFFMDFKDFIQNYNRIYVLRLLTDDDGEKWNKFPFLGEWNAETAGGCTNHPTWYKNPQYGVEPTEAGKVFCCLGVPDLRYVCKAAPNQHGRHYEPIGIAVYESEDLRYKKSTTNGSDRLGTSLFCPVRDLSYEFQVQPGKRYVVIPCTFQPKVISKLDFTIYTQHAAQVFEITASIPRKSLKSAWSGRSAGGCVNTPASFFNNPQFVVVSDRPGKVEISLEQDPHSQGLECIGIYVFKGPGAGRRAQGNAGPMLFTPPTFIDTPMVSGEFRVDSGVQYLIMPCLFEAGVERTFTLSVCSPDGGNLTFQPAA